MPFINIDQIPAFEVLPGVRIRAPHGGNLMLTEVMAREKEPQQIDLEALATARMM
jgi:hypothetical protein